MKKIEASTPVKLIFIRHQNEYETGLHMQLYNFIKITPGISFIEA